MAETTVANPTIDTAPIDGTPVPAVEAFAHAMAAQAHQAAAATPEDAPHEPVAGRLPFPRPPFDFEGRIAKVEAARIEARALETFARDAERTAKLAKKRADAALDDHANARAEFEKLADQFLDDYHASTRDPEPEQLTLTHGAECAWEREHPGQVCTICSGERETHRARLEEQAIQQVLEANGLDVDVAAHERVGVIVKVNPPTDVEGPCKAMYYVIDPEAEGGWTWSEAIEDAALFDTEEQARVAITEAGIALDLDGGIEFVPDPMAADPAAAANEVAPATTEPAFEEPAAAEEAADVGA